MHSSFMSRALHFVGMVGTYDSVNKEGEALEKQGLRRTIGVEQAYFHTARKDGQVWIQ